MHDNDYYIVSIKLYLLTGVDFGLDLGLPHSEETLLFLNLSCTLDIKPALRQLNVEIAMGANMEDFVKCIFTFRFLLLMHALLVFL